MKQKNIAIWLSLVAAVATGIFIIYKLASSPADITKTETGGEAALVILAAKNDDWFKGGKEAQAVLIEYSDFQCPACRAFAPVLEQLHQEFGDNLKIIYRHFPLFQIHSNAILAAEAVEAAGREGKFWEMHDKIFEGQSEWEKSPKAREIFKNYALSLGLDGEKFLADLDSKEVKERVADDLKEAQTIGLNYTPTFFLARRSLGEGGIGGKKIENPRSYDEFRALISQTLTQSEED